MVSVALWELRVFRWAQVRTPLSEITSTGEIEQRFRSNGAMGPPGLSSPTAQVEYRQNKDVNVS